MSIEHGQLVDFIRKTPFEYPEEAIHLFLAGSHLHGARIPGKSDMDVMGIYVEPPSVAFAVGAKIEKGIVLGTSDPNVKNTAEDEDITMKTLREWARLACKGNPTVIAALFTTSDVDDPSLTSSVWSYIQGNKHAFLAKSHAKAFLGYGREQYDRFCGKRGKGKHGQERPELVTKFGYDTKMAMHLLRLMYEGIELMEGWHITYPRPEVELLLDARNGKFTRKEIEARFLGLEADLMHAAEVTSLPEFVQQEDINQLVATSYLEHWKIRGWL